MSEPDDDAFARFVFDDAPQPGYTSLPPLTLDEMTALLDSLKRRLVVPVERVEEFETAVRTAGLGHAVTVVGHPLLNEDQAFLMQSEAQLEADMLAAANRAVTESFETLRAQTEAAPDLARAYLDGQAREKLVHDLVHRKYDLPPRSPFRGLSGP